MNAHADHIHKKIIPLWHPDAPCPELHHLSYAIRAAITPTIVLNQVPQTLTLLAHVDCIRELLLRRLAEISKLDDRLKQAPQTPDVNVLIEDERTEIELLSNRMGGRMRNSYRELVNSYSLYVCSRFMSVLPRTYHVE